MKLKNVTITNFRSVENSGPFSIEQVTCLVGKNEAGKSAILQALASLNPHPSTPFKLDKERDYPRRFLTEYAARHSADEAIVVTTIWEITDEEKAAIKKEFGTGALNSTDVEIKRRYNKDAEWVIGVNFGKIFEYLFKKFELEDAEIVPLQGATSTKTLIEKITKLETKSAHQAALLAELTRLASITGVIKNILVSRFPCFMYFSNYDRMEGAIQLDHLNQLKANKQIEKDEFKGFRLFDEFLAYAGVPITEITKIGTYETFNAKLEAASNNITDQILEYWTQNPDLRVHVKIEQARPQDTPPLNTGMVARARIYNDLHRVETPFSERSAGFIWFFSFLVKFAQVKNDKVPVILLLDEPGLSLHGKAQGDLLRYFDEKLSPHHQLIYSTHSPFMVAADKLMSARVVEDQIVVASNGRRSPLGTKVSDDVLSTDPDTLFPLQGALGYEITQTLFIGKHTLLVEGPSDILYLQALSAALKRLGRVGIDTRWTICPSGGIGNIRSFVSLFAGNKIEVAVLADYAIGQKKPVETLRASKILKTGRVLTIDQFVGKAEADTEDLFDADLFVELLNSAYALSGVKAITAASLNAADQNTPRLVKKAEALFNVQADPAAPAFDHFVPAQWLIANPGFLDASKPSVATTLARAESLMSALNALLS